MDHLKSSYQFHLQLEPPSAFFRREWKPVLLFGGGFCLLMLTLVFVADPAFFYPRLLADPLNYLLKARSLVENGTTSARAAVNIAPFPYAAMPGVLRTPFLLFFREFDDQLRGIQVFNIPIVASVALMSAYILSWTQPVRRHWMVIAFAFAFTLLSPMWIANVTLPLADAPYAAFTLAALLVTVRIVCSSARPATRPRAIAASVVLFVVASMLRFTGPALLVFAGALARGRWGKGSLSLRSKAAIAAATLVLLALLVGFNLNAIFGRYLFEPLNFLVKGDKAGMVLNLLGASLPSQIIPNFQLGFKHPPIDTLYHTTFANSAADAAWMTVGLIISAFVIAGAWLSRARFLPEILYVLVPLPVLAVVMPSTTRYLMSYQPFFWIFFYVGASRFVTKYSRRVPAVVRSRAAVTTAALVVLAVVVGLRWWRLAGTASERNFAVTLTNAPRYISDVSTTFRGLRGFLESLPADRTLLVGGPGSTGRWTLIADRDYYVPDSALGTVVKSKNVYLLVECGTLEACQAWSFWTSLVQRGVTEYGDFAFDSVFAAASPQARVEVFRIRTR